MHRTQIQLEERQYRFLKTRAREKGKSLSALLRELVDASIRGEAKEAEPLLEIVGMVDGPDHCTARAHDRFLQVADSPKRIESEQRRPRPGQPDN